MMQIRGRHLWGLLLASLSVFPGNLPAQDVTVRGQVVLVPMKKRSRTAAHSHAVVWLTPLEDAAADSNRSDQRPAGHYRLVQKNKQFTPHILVIPAGSTVEFPNQDPFFHNVFSLFNGKRFDLGLYEAGSTRSVRFNDPGISYIFCNIHPEMSAVVIALKTRYYAASNRDGLVVIRGVPPGRYRLHVWDEHCLPATLRAVEREVHISPASPSWGELRLAESGDLLRKHKNLYGKDYDPTASSYPDFDQP